MSRRFSASASANRLTKQALFCCAVWLVGGFPEQAEAQFTTVINAPPSTVANNTTLQSDTQLNVSSGGTVGQNVNAGKVDGTSTNVEVNMAGGQIRTGFRANAGSTVRISGGVVQSLFTANPGSQVFVSGSGSVVSHLVANGSTVDISGGSVGDDSDAMNGSIINVSGGSLGSFFDALTNSTINISGGIVGRRLNAGASNGTSTNVVVHISGGTVGDEFNAYAGSTVNITGGTVGPEHFIGLGMEAYGGSTVNISGGVVYGPLYALNGSVVNVSGGTVRHLAVDPNSIVNISGGIFTNSFSLRGGTLNLSGGSIHGPLNGEGTAVHFFGDEMRLNGVPISGLENVGNSVSISVESPNDLLSGTFADGTPFALRDAGVYQLHVSALPPAPALVTASQDPVGLGVRGGQTLIVDSGAVLPDQFNSGWGSNMIVQTGGTVGRRLRAAGATITVEGGNIGQLFQAYEGSVINLHSGSIGNNFSLQRGSTLNMSGGTIGELMGAWESTVNLSGGLIKDEFNTLPGTELNLYGNDFRLDGVPIDGLENIGDSTMLDLPDWSVLSGSFADGTPFTFKEGLFYFDVPFHLHATAPAPPGPSVITASTDPVPQGIRDGQTLVVDAGGSVGDYFQAGRGSTVTIHAGGVVGQKLRAAGAVVTVAAGGMLLENADAFAGTRLNVSGGTVGGQLSAYGGSEINISGGTMGSFFNAESGSVVNISGGAVGQLFQAFAGSTVIISGGTFGNGFNAGSGSSINFFGTEFLLNGAPISGLTQGAQFLLQTRNQQLTATLADGSVVSFDLNSTGSYPDDVFSPQATVTLTLVLPGDHNLDGAVDAADYVVWRKNGGTQAAYDTWRANFGRAAGGDDGAAALTSDAQVPEPSSFFLFVSCWLALIINSPRCQRRCGARC